MKIFTGGTDGQFNATYVLTKELGNMILGAQEVDQIFGDPWVETLSLVYLPYCWNRELVLYDRMSKLLFEGDMLFNLGIVDSSGTHEQYSPATGYPEKHNPFAGWSYLFGFMNPKTRTGWLSHCWFNLLMRESRRKGLRLIYSMDFESIVPCHGNIFERDGNEVFQDAFPKLFGADHHEISETHFGAR